MNTDWWQGHAGPEKGKRLTWQRIEPGYYRLRGTDIYIANMKGSSVRWSGLVTDPWEVRDEENHVITNVGTMKEAKEAALAYARREVHECHDRPPPAQPHPG
jgi:hypothetical protein